MKFGTIHNFVRDDRGQSISTNPVANNASELDDDIDTTGFDSTQFADPQNTFDDELDNGKEENPIVSKLLSLKSEIDSILSDMGYGYSEDEMPEIEDGNEFEFGSSGDDNEQFDFNSEANPDLNQPADFGEKKNSDEPDATEEDVNFQGNIRTVQGADLVYKRKIEDGNYEELWIYNVGKDIRKETQIRKAILAGTDIVPSQRESEDGTQRADTYTVGNVQYLTITGLPN